jgi:predicted NAD/FAD-binding protein
VNTGDGSVRVDTGFIVFNPHSYPNLVALFDHLGVDTPTPGNGVVTAMRGDLAYSMALKVDDRKMMLSFSVLFYQIDKNTVLNRAKVKKFGIPVGQVLISFRKE